MFPSGPPQNLFAGVMGRPAPAILNCSYRFLSCDFAGREPELHCRSELAVILNLIFGRPDSLASVSGGIVCVLFLPAYACLDPLEYVPLDKHIRGVLEGFP